VTWPGHAAISTNGDVDFRDFVTFAQVFGAKEGDADYDARFDSKGNGSVSFEDFVQFAANFGSG